jgi:hypothetical protein
VKVTASSPLAPRQHVGRVTVRVNNLVVGRAPVEVSRVLGPVNPPNPPGPSESAAAPWWDALGRLASGLYHSVFG